MYKCSLKLSENNNSKAYTLEDLSHTGMLEQRCYQSPLERKEGDVDTHVMRFIITTCSTACNTLIPRVIDFRSPQQSTIRHKQLILLKPEEIYLLTRRYLGARVRVGPTEPQPHANHKKTTQTKVQRGCDTCILARWYTIIL